MGAASSSRWAPLSRSTMTPMPENIVFSGISRPIVADGDERLVVDAAAPEAAERLLQRGRDHDGEEHRREQRDDELARRSRA